MERIPDIFSWECQQGGILFFSRPNVRVNTHTPKLPAKLYPEPGYTDKSRVQARVWVRCTGKMGQKKCPGLKNEGNYASSSQSSRLRRNRMIPTTTITAITTIITI